MIVCVPTRLMIFLFRTVFSATKPPSHGSAFDQGSQIKENRAAASGRPLDNLHTRSFVQKRLAARTADPRRLRWVHRWHWVFRILQIRHQVVRSSTWATRDVRVLDDRLVEIDDHRIDRRQDPTVVFTRVTSGRSRGHAVRCGAARWSWTAAGDSSTGSARHSAHANSRCGYLYEHERRVRPDIVTSSPCAVWVPQCLQAAPVKSQTSTRYSSPMAGLPH